MRENHMTQDHTVSKPSIHTQTTIETHSFRGLYMNGTICPRTFSTQAPSLSPFRRYLAQSSADWSSDSIYDEDEDIRYKYPLKWDVQVHNAHEMEWLRYYNKNQWVLYPRLEIQVNCFCVAIFPKDKWNIPTLTEEIVL